MRVPRLTHPALDPWIDLRLRASDGRLLAVAELADTPVIDATEPPSEALSGSSALGAEAGGGWAAAKDGGHVPPSYAGVLDYLAGTLGRTGPTRRTSR